jgi:hypothetical protein
MKLRIVTLLPLFAAGAWAGTACQSGTLATLVAQGQCTIGNLDFNFLDASLIYGLAGSTPTDTSGIGFVPLVAAGMQGFRLTGPLSGSGAEGTANTTYGRITYNVLGAANLEVTTLLGEAAVSAHPDTDCELGIGYCYVDAFAMSGIGLEFGNSTYAALGQAYGAGQSPSTTTTPAGWLALGPFTSSDIWVSYASIGLQVNTGGSNHDGSASAYLSSATFWFRDVQSDAPEPGTLLLMAAACAPLFWLRAHRAR